MTEPPPRRAYRPAPPRSVTERDRWGSGPTGWRAVAAMVFVLDLALGCWLWATDPRAWPVAGTVVVIPLLVLVTTPLFLWAARTETRFDLAGLLATGLLLRFAASLYRFDNAVDARVYHAVGSNLARSFRHFDFAVDVRGKFPGTGGLNYISGLVEVVTNANFFATFLVFTWLGFVGCVLFYRAFTLALPDVDPRRYALLVFLWPTLVFWPSSIGKDCWMVFTLGVAALGAARVLRRLPGGYLVLAAGLLGGSLVRPHVSLVLLVAFAIALLVGRQPDRSGVITPTSVAKVTGLVVLLVLGGVLAERFGTLVGSTDITDINAVLDINADRTEQGGSAFSPADPTTPLGYAQSFLNVVFRPFPSETGNLEQTAAAVEAILLWCIVVASWRRLATVPKRLRDQPYVTLALCYVLMFIFGFGTIANYGILARQRSQLMPFLFVLVSVGAVYRTRVTPSVTRSGQARSTRRPVRSSSSRAVAS